MTFDKLLSPIKIRGLELKNRIIMTGMGTKMNDQSAVTDMLVNYHAARAAGGVALNTLEVCSVDAASAPKNFVSIAEDRLMPGHKKLTDAIHANGGKANIQLWQGALAVGSDPDAEIIFINDVSTERIMEIIENYGKAAKRAVDCGYDVVELHAAHNYLPHMFLSGGMNFRDDEWGGSLENRMRFPLMVIESIRRNIPEDMPMFMRVDCFDDYLPGGLTIEEVIEFCKRAGKAGVDVLDISRGNFMVTDALIYETPPMDLPHFYNVAATERIRRETGMLAMPTGRFNFPDMAEQVLEEDKADLVVMARAQIADPQFVNKLRAGKLSNIKYCIGCNQGCHSYFLNPEKPHISCLRNPAVGEEAKYIIRKTEEPKKILILGGGMAGLEAADLLHDMGHTPVIYEESDHLGGQFLLAGKAPRKADIERAVTLFGQNAIDLGVEIHMNTKATADTIKAEKPDAVIVAIGSSAVIPPIPGADKKNVLNARDVMAGTEIPVGKTVIVGGGLVGIECAEYLAVRGHNVTIIEMRDEALTELDEMRKIGTRLAMEKEDITIQLNAKCKEVLDGKVIVDVLSEEKEFDADNVLMAVGARPRSSEELIAACDELGIPYYVVGDAKKAGFALDAVYDAFHACFDIQDKETNA